MNYQQPNASDVSGTANRSRNVAPQSGLCSRCIDGCRGNCEVFKSSFRGREVIYPEPFGTITAGGDKQYPVDYSHLNIMGYALGAEGLPEGVPADSDHALFPSVGTEVQYGTKNKVKLAMPLFTGALGSTDVARNNWDHIAVGCAIAGITVVCGENVCGIDPQLVLNKDGKIHEAPDMRRRIEMYKRHQKDLGDVIVQMNVEDTRIGVAEYVLEKLGVETIELKWGQGAKCIGGEIQVDSLARALELQRRGYMLTPNPSEPSAQRAHDAGAVKSFERHSRLGFVDEESFAAEVQRLRNLGAKRVTLKTGAYPARELAMALKWSSDAGIDLLTIDGAGGGTGMSPWRMMEEWGVPTFYLQSLTQEFCSKLAAKGAFVPDIAIAGGFSTEDHIFKVLAMGAPYTKAVCMGRALMIPGFVGKNIGEWLKQGDLPKSVSAYGTTISEIFVTYAELRERFGAEVDELPLGAIGVYTFCQKLKVGLQQLMAGARKFNPSAITREDVIALTEEAAKVSGLSYVMDAYREEAELILNG